jgi:hypothetical protein
MMKNIRSPSTEPHTDGRPTYCGVQAGFSRGSLMTLLSLRQCHAALGMIISKNVTTSHVTHGRVEYKSMIPWVQTSGWIYGRLLKWYTCIWLQMKMQTKDNVVTVTQVDTSVESSLFIYYRILK